MTVFELYRLNGSSDGPDAFKKSLKKFSHSLSKWHKELKDAFENVAESLSLSQAMLDDFVTHYEKTRIGMEAFERLDVGSDRFRFPTDMQGQLIWSFFRASKSTCLTKR